MKLPLLAVPLLLLTLPEAAASAQTSRASSQCRAAAQGDWSAHVNAMPGPGARRTLIVTGIIGVKPAARTRLRLAPEVMESDPPQYTVILDISLPRRPTIDMLERRNVRGQWPVRGEVGAVHIRCGGRIVATVRDVVTAH
jgi:hypothetical protein